MIHIIGGGLAGSEAAWQAAELGVPVMISEMRPLRPTAVHKTDSFAELVCSNSFRGDKLDNAVGLLKEEMRRLGSLIMRAADAARVPAGAALAVDRVVFAERVTETLSRHPLVTISRGEITAIPAPGGGPVIVATGPLTSDALSASIRAFVGSDHLAFYDAISPIVLAETIDMSKVFRASRWDRSLRGGGDRGGTGDMGAAGAAGAAGGQGASGASGAAGGQGASGASGAAGGQSASGASGAAGADVACGVDDGQGDYLNCPMTRDEYAAFYRAVTTAESATVHDFDRAKFFEGCLPIEVMAHRGVDTLRFGPMKPVGLTDPRTRRVPYAVVQLRQDTLAGDHFSLVGFQTQLKWGEQARILRMIPGLEQAEFVRFGMVHRNTFINGPTVLEATWQTRRRSDLFFAGQVSGVEGYVESAASGLLAGRNAAALVQGRPPSALPRTTAIGALAYYASHADPTTYQPSNITHGIMAPLDDPPRDKAKKKALIAARALADLDAWQHEHAALPR